MWRIVSIAFLLGALISAGPAIPAQDKKPNGEATLDGTWKVLVDSDEFVVEIRGKKLIGRRLKNKERKEDEEVSVDLRIDHSATPKQFDVIHDGKTISVGIFELHGDTLIVCGALENRPTEFNTRLIGERPESVMLVMKRQNVKKEK